MRALPIIVDLFVLLSVLALTLFFAAIGRSAPNESSQRLMLVEVTANLSGPSGNIGAHSLIDFFPEVVGQDGQRRSVEIVQVPSASLSKERYLIRNVEADAVFRASIENVEVEAFSYSNLEVEISRLFPSPEKKVNFSSALGRFSIANLELAQ